MTFQTGMGRLPADIERNALGGPRFNTTVFELDSGYEKRNINWSLTRGEWDVGYGLLTKFQDDPSSTKLDLDELIHFFYTARGKAYSWRFKDWSDYEIGFENGTQISAQFLAFGDGVNTQFQTQKRYQAGTAPTFIRDITKVVSGTEEVYIEAVLQTSPGDYSIDYDTGIITFTSPPAATGGSGPGGAETITIRCEFDCHVRFDTDDLKINMALFNSGSWPNIPIVELLGTGL